MWRWVWLALAMLWSGAATAVLTLDHIFGQPSTVWLQVGSRTSYTHYPPPTLVQRDHVSAEIILTAVWIAVLVGFGDLIDRSSRRSPRSGGPAIFAGGMLIAFSLFGLAYGVLGLAPLGVLIMLSGQRTRLRSPSASPEIFV